MMPMVRRAGLLLLVLALSPVPGAGVTARADRPPGAFDAAVLADPGPYATDVREVVVSRPEADGGDFPARLYVPLPLAADASLGDDTAGPVLAFGHGYLTPVELYESTLEHLASWGITTIAPRSGGELFPSHERFADDLVAALDWVFAAAEAVDWPGLPVDASARGVAGHSMGGGAAMLAAASDPRIHVVATLAAAETRPSAIEAAARIDAPALFLAGSDDDITPVDEHQRPMFEAKTTGVAWLGTIMGGSHCGFMDSEPTLFGLACDDAAIARTEQLAATRAALVAWLRQGVGAGATEADMARPGGADGAPLVVWECTRHSTVGLDRGSSRQNGVGMCLSGRSGSW